MIGSFVSIAGGCTVLVVAVATAVHPEGPLGPTFWATISLIITTIIGFVFQAWRESRDRRWRQEDDLAKAFIARNLITHDKQVTELRQELKHAVAENTEISMNAFKETSCVNQKLERLLKHREKNE